MTILILVLCTVVIASLMPIWRHWQPRYSIMYTVVLALSVLAIYWQIGGISGLRAYEAMQAFNTQPDRVSYEHLQDTLDAHIDETDDPLSHLLQARLYFADKDYQHAVDAFERAYGSLEQDTGVLVEYATALYFLNAKDSRLPVLLSTLRETDNMPMAAHSLLANIAMDQNDKANAKLHWEALLNALPANSEQRPYVEALIQKM